MTSIAAFNHSLKEFLGDLASTFPEKPEIAFYEQFLPTLLQTDERAGLTYFMNATRDHGQKLMNRDESFFAEDICIGKGLNLSDLWNDEGLDTDSKNAIWDHLNMLFVLGMTIEGVNENVLSGIESLAQSAAQKIQSGEASFGTLLPELMSSVGSMMGVQAPNDEESMSAFNDMLGSMLGGLQFDSEQKKLE